MPLNPQDLLVALKLVSIGRSTDWTYQLLAQSLGVSTSESHTSIKRLVASQLASNDGTGDVVVNRKNVYEYICFGLRYAQPAEYSGPATGVLCSLHAVAEFGFPPDKCTSVVWPSAEQSDSGSGVKPFYKAVPTAARKDSQLYSLLVLVENIRMAQPGNDIFRFSCDCLQNVLAEESGYAIAAFPNPETVSRSCEKLAAER